MMTINTIVTTSKITTSRPPAAPPMKITSELTGGSLPRVNVISVVAAVVVVTKSGTKKNKINNDNINIISSIIFSNLVSAS